MAGNATAASLDRVLRFLPEGADWLDVDVQGAELGIFNAATELGAAGLGKHPCPMMHRDRKCMAPGTPRSHGSTGAIVHSASSGAEVVKHPPGRTLESTQCRF